MNSELTAELIKKIERARDVDSLGKFSPHDFVLRHGREYEFRKRPRKYGAGESRLCYWNSKNSVLKKSGLIYVEGFVLWDFADHLSSVQHAWFVERDAPSIVIDRSLAGVAYWGIPFQTEYLRQRWKAYPDGVNMLGNDNPNPIFNLTDDELRNVFETTD